MNLAQLWAEIESDKAWRQSEIRFLQNQAENLLVEKDKEQFRRALVLLLYAHFEGFCKFVFLLYINEVNSAGITCGDANFAIAAASLDDLFRALRDTDRKCPEFKNTLPDERKLHRFARDREFLERTSEFAARSVRIPETIADTESNLTPFVLQKILYRLGFPFDQFKSIEGDIHFLLERRNLISHGATRSGIDEVSYEKLRNSTYRIMDEVARQVMEALQSETYLKMNSGSAPS